MGELTHTHHGAHRRGEHGSGDNDEWIEPVARAGYGAKGVVYVLIGLLSGLAAFEAGGKTTGSRGALVTVLHQPFGRVLLGVIAVGLVAYAVWRCVQAIRDTEGKGSDAKGIIMRGSFILIGIAYAALGYYAATLALGTSNGSSGGGTKDITATLLSQPFGPWLVGGVALAVIAFSLFQLYQAFQRDVRKKLKEDEMDDDAEQLAVTTGRAGLVSRGFVFGLAGVFLMQAALQSDAREARGLNGTLQSLEETPFGPWLLGTVALGLIAYGVYMFVLARYRRIDV